MTSINLIENIDLEYILARATSLLGLSAFALEAGTNFNGKTPMEAYDPRDKDFLVWLHTKSRLHTHPSLSLLDGPILVQILFPLSERRIHSLKILLIPKSIALYISLLYVDEK